jgi:hypothetical protein
MTSHHHHDGAFTSVVIDPEHDKIPGCIFKDVDEAKDSAKRENRKLQRHEAEATSEVQEEEAGVTSKVHVVDTSMMKGTQGHLSKLASMLTREACVLDYLVIRMSRLNMLLQCLVGLLPVLMAVLLTFARDVFPDDKVLGHSITMVFVTGHVVVVYASNHLKLVHKIWDAEKMQTAVESLLTRVTLAQSNPNMKDMEALLLDVESQMEKLGKDFGFHPPKWAYQVFAKKEGKKNHLLLIE